MSLVTASVIAWNDRDHLLRCLTSLREQRGVALRIFVVDNGSTDGCAEAVRRDFPDAAILSPGENLGYAGAHNLAFGATDDPYFLVLNADVVLDAGYVARLVGVMEADPGVGAASGKLLRTDAPELLDSAGIAPDARGRFRDRETGFRDDGQVPAGDVFGVCGAAALYRRAALIDAVPDVLGAGRPFDAAFFAYYEDADLAWALRRRGWRARIVADATARHVRGGSGASSALVERLLHRNAFWVLVKHARIRDLARIAPGLVLSELVKLAQAFTTKPFLRIAWRERIAGLRAMRARRHALRANEARPRTVPVPDLQLRERALRDAQAESYEAIAGGPYHEVVEIGATLDHLGARPGERVIDLGCGTGRLAARIAAAGARVMGVDFSLESLREAKRLAPGALFVQADLTRLPFAEGAFDRAVSSQVFHHLPDGDLRRRGAAEAARVLRKEGVLTLLAYHDAWIRRAFLPREGFHPGGIFYHRFRRGELRRLLGECFEVLACVGVRHFPARSVGERLMHRRGFTWIPRLDRWLERRSLFSGLAHFVLVKGVKKGGDTP